MFDEDDEYMDAIVAEWEELPDDDMYGDHEEFRCCMPDRCLMVGEHYASECHDAEMLESWEREMKRSDRP